jgi:hypothetical protein
MFRSNNFWKAQILSWLGLILSVFGIFWNLNEISVLIVFAIELALPVL